MHILKPEHILFQQQVIQREGRFDNVLVLLCAFRLSAPEVLIPESEWVSAVAPYLQGRVLDEGWPKTRGEVLVFGEFKVQDPRAPYGQVRVQINQVDKSLLIFPKRHWQEVRPGEYVQVVDGPLTDLSLTDAYAFGGDGFAENPAGIGYWPTTERERLARAAKPLALPQMEIANRLVMQPDHNEQQAVASFLPQTLNHPQRLRHYGAMDAEYFAQDYPGLPKGTAPGFYQMAPLDQQIEGWFVPGESLQLNGMTEQGELTSHLPGYRARCFVPADKQGQTAELIELPTQLDSVLLFPNVDMGVMGFRVVVEAQSHRAEEFSSYLLAIDHAQAQQQRPLVHYQEAYAHRRGPKRELYVLKNDDLLPEGIVASAAPQTISQAPKSPKKLPDGSQPLPQLNVRTLNAKLQQAGVVAPAMVAPTIPTLQQVVLPEDAQQLANQAAAIHSLQETLWSDAAAELTTLQAVPELSAFSALSLSAPMVAAGGAAASALPALADVQRRQLHKALQLAAGHSASAQTTGSAPDSTGRSERLPVEASNARLSALLGHAVRADSASDAANKVGSVQWISHQDCRGLDLSNLTLSHWAFEHCDFTGAKFNNTGLQHVQFHQCCFDKAEFQQTHVEEGLFHHSQGSDVDWREFSSQQTRWESCHFRDSVAYQSQWHNDQFDHCEWTHVTWVESCFVGVRCERGLWVQCQLNTLQSPVHDWLATPHETVATPAALQDCYFSNTHWQRCQFVGTAWQRCVWSQVTAVGSAFSGATALFDQGQWNAVDLQECNLTQLQLCNSTLTQCQLAENVLLDAQFTDLKIAACDWQGVQLANSRWTRCAIEHSDFSHANAMGSEWLQCQLSHNRWQGVGRVYLKAQETDFN